MEAHRTISLCGKKLNRPGHICAFFDSREQEYDVLSPYFAEGLECGEEVVTIVDSADIPTHASRLKARGITVESAMASGQLKILSSEDTYTQSGRFSSQRMYQLLQGALADAQRKKRRVRTAGVMGWSTRGHPGTEELMDYEARVNVLVPMYDCTLLCVYDLSEMSGSMVMDVLATHPYVIRGKSILENPYYVPPINVLKDALKGSVASPSAQPGLPA